MKKKLIVITALIMLTVSLASCVQIPKDQPIGIWVCDDPPMTFNFNDHLTQGNIKCTIELEGEEYIFEEVRVPRGENKIELGAPYDGIDPVSHSNFSPEMYLTYWVEDDTFFVNIDYSIYDEYPGRTQLEFEYQGEGKGIIRYP